MPGRQKTAFMSSTLIFLLFIPLIQSEDLMDITTSVFGNFSGVIPAAFGDFNGDKLTDMFVLSVELEPPHEVVKVTVLLAQEQKVVGSASSISPLFQWGTAKQKLQCRIAKVRRWNKKGWQFLTVVGFFSKGTSQVHWIRIKFQDFVPILKKVF